MHRRITQLLVVVSAVWLLAESGYGLLQVFGKVRSRHALYAMTGHFLNPGPYGGFLGMLISICFAACLLQRDNLEWRTIWRWTTRVAVVLGLIILPATMSRAGWLGLGVSIAILGLRDGKVQQWFRKKKIRTDLSVLLISIVCAGLFLVKKDSALGRFHIWHMELLSVLEHPWTGVGGGNFASAYGETQTRYFLDASRSAWEVRVAGCPEFAFNEYLKVGVEWGVVGLILAVVLTIWTCTVLIRHNNPLGYGAVSLSVFSFFSYPLVFWQFQLYAGLFLFAALSEQLPKFAPYIYVSYIVSVCAIGLVRNHTPARPDYRDLYAQGHMLFEAGEYERALPILQEGAARSCDPMFHNVMGRCHEALGHDLEAEKEYLRAHYMVPGRLYPLVLLEELYLSRGDSLRAREMFSAIEAIPVNPKNPTMKSLRERAEKNQIQS